MPITRVLVANRGEIARRVFATCRRLGLGTVAVYTEPDAAAPHVTEADARVRLPKTNDYLNAEAVIAAARAAGADAVHPGYGFLSENADFAAAVQEAGLTWVGPPVDAVRAMGSKIESKKLMAAAGVPVLDELDPDTVTQAQLPVLVKASAGGGGRGMRVVRELSALPAEVEAARREAQSAFGDPTVFCERYLPPDTTSRYRSWPTCTAPCGLSANGNAPFSAATRRSSKRRRHRWWSASRACAPSCSTRPGWPPPRSAMPAPAPWSSLPMMTASSTSWK
ncbi:carbamoyl-phosphate synthase L chain, ATP binding domain protein [Mycobacterium kansasii]|uniref:Carbamoyl-phosphate synthase L chain, ATP binding domain protein n=1 Tax=Mycobacterium kansasii TaxID=1768 RepID=A0A1V3XJI8_MYCKA|nr:carbamoyl-phosphate synthase L chain, ATP binding domain protein [Mycobacterium kansasii]